MKSKYRFPEEEGKMETNMVILRNGIGRVDYDGEIHMLSEEEQEEFWKKRFKREDRFAGIGIIVFIFLASNLIACSIGIYNITASYFKKPPAQVNYIESETKELNKQKIKIRAIISDDTDPAEVKDRYITQLLVNSNWWFDQFFNFTTLPLRKNITIFFIDQKTWDGEKACSWNKAGGCNIQDGEKNIILIPLSQDIENDLRTLNHERTHAYFLYEPEIAAHLVENLFDNRLDLSQRSFRLYRDDQGKLRF